MDSADVSITVNLRLFSGILDNYNEEQQVNLTTTMAKKQKNNNKLV